MNKPSTPFFSALFIAISSAFLALPAHAQPSDCGPGEGRPAGRMVEQMKQRQQELHTALKLNPEQEKAWAKLQASHPLAHPGADRPERSEMAKLSAPERAEKMLELQKQHQEAMSQHVTALKSFYSQLTPEQRKTFDEHQWQGGHRPSRNGPPGGSRPTTDAGNQPPAR